MSLDEFFAHDGTEAPCAAALEASRWPQGFVCPHCGATTHSRFYAGGREDWPCAQCRVQTSLTCGTLFASSKLPLTKRFQAFDLVTQNKNDLSALALKRHLGVCDRTAWRLKHKLLEPMAERESDRLLTGTVVTDDALVGGKRGRGAEGKAVFIAAVELDEDGDPQHGRFDPLPDIKGDTLRTWVRKALDPTAYLVTDADASLARAGAEVTSHEPIVVSSRQSSVRWTPCQGPFWAEFWLVRSL
jgi:transposase-like protein